MANEENLKRLNSREARENGKKGGKASVESRRRKKSMKEAMNKLLSLDVSENNKQLLTQLGLEDSDMNNQMLVMVSAFQKAINGDVSAMNFIANITGSYAMSESDRQKIKLEKERIKLEKEKLNKNEEEYDEGVEIKI
jgi:hypothetical protein